MRHLLVSVVLITLTGCALGNPTTPPPPDPCDPSVHTELDEPHRSTAFKIEYPERPRCDIDLSPGWYRFTSQAGGTMPTSCPDQFACGTVVPLWMKGEHPSFNDGIVTRQACGNFLSGSQQEDNCCDYSIDIKVKKCGTFFVYYLSPIPSCPVAYCAGGTAPCPVGKWSSTGFPPCDDAYPLLTDSPTLEGPIISSNQFEFKCEFTYKGSHADQVFDVIWTFDGLEDPNVGSQQVVDPSRSAKLDGALLKNHINSKLDCRVRAYYRGNQNVKSDWVISNSYYAGILVSPAKLIISEKEHVKEIDIISTIPIMCSVYSFGCCLTFVLDIDKEDSAFITTKCRYEMCSNDWDQDKKIAIISVTVVANQDFKNEGDKELFITFEKLLTPSLLGDYLSVFHEHEPDRVNVVVEDEETFICTIWGDPHFESFDGKSYDLYLLGDFTVYEVPERHFQIQISTWACSAGVTCICAIAILEENDIIRINQCDQMYSGHRTSPIIDTGGRPLREGVVIQRSKDGSTIGIYLLSGAQIKVKAYSNSMDVDITGPGVDKNKAKGICGTYDGNNNNEFTYPDGTVDQDASDNFYEAWRPGPNENLFKVLPPIVPVNDEFTYCTCNEHEAKINCTSRASITQNIICYGDCTDVTANVQTIIPVIVAADERNKREAVYGDFDTSDDLSSAQEANSTADLNKEWQSVEGITEAQAREMCNRALERSQLNNKCGGSDSSMTAGFMKGCLADIKYSGTTAFLDSMTSAFTSRCQLNLAKDPANYVTSPEGKSIMKPEFLDDICDLKCDKHGSCGDKGVCVCDSGWEGYNCHIQSGIGPQLDRIRSGPFCDLAQRPCQRVFLDVSNTDLSDDLICRVQKVDDQGNNIGEPTDTVATFLSAFRIACALPETTVSYQVYKISASNDGSLFGNQLSVRVFDSTCLDCDEAGCIEKTTACHINNVCYIDGTIHEENSLKVCDVSMDTTDWTDKTVCRGVQIADIIFVVDASGSIGDSNFAQQLSFLSNLTKNFVLGPDNVRFGAVVFASSAQKLFDLKDHSDHTSLANAITSTSYTRGGTNTAAALNLVGDQNMFDPASGGRANATKIVIVITDGRSNSQSKTVEASQSLKDAGVQMISIGVGGNTREDELEQIASGSENVFEVSGFDVLSHIEEQVTKQTCGPA